MLELEDYVETVVDPKVMVPYDSKVGETPRRVQIERCCPSVWALNLDCTFVTPASY